METLKRFGSPTENPSPAKRSHVQSLQSRAAEDCLQDLSVGLLKGEDGYANYHSPLAVDAYKEARKLIFVALNDQDDAVCVNLNGSVLTLRDAEMNVEMEMNGVKKLLVGTSISKIKETLRLDLSCALSPNSNKVWRPYLSNLDTLKGRFSIYNNAIMSQGFDKSRGYVSMKNDRKIAQLNCQVTLPDANIDAECRHFATEVARRSMQHPKGKVDLSCFNDAQSVVKTLPITIDYDTDLMVGYGKSYELVENDKFGRKIIGWFNDIQGNLATHKNVLIFSMDHLMQMTLRIKEKTGKPVYVMKFYNPEFTNIVFTIRAHDLSVFEFDSLKRYINGSAKDNEQDIYQEYFGDQTICMVVESDLHADASTEPKKITHVDHGTLTPAHLYYFCGFGVDGLQNIQSHLQQIGESSPNKLIELLSAANSNGTSSFHFAIADGNYDYLRTCLALLQGLKPSMSDSKLAELLASEDIVGFPGIYYALERNRVDIIHLYAEFLDLFSSQDAQPKFTSLDVASGVYELLAGKRNGDGTLIHPAFNNADERMAEVFYSLVRALSEFIPGTELDKLVTRFKNGATK